MKTENNTISGIFKTCVLLSGMCLISPNAEAQSQSRKTSSLQNPSKKELTSPATFRNEEYKTTWITDHPEEYKNMGGQISPELQSQINNKAMSIQSNAPKKMIVIFPEIPSFPKYVQTGNPQADDENYRVNKEAWINSHQAEYNQMNQLGTSESKNRVKTVIND